MSKKTLLALAALVIAFPATAYSQVGIGVKAGTLGVGGEVSFGLNSRLAIRGGLGSIPAEPKFTLSDIEYTINPPSTIWNIGVDVFPFGGGFHVSAGLLNRKRYELELNGSGTQEVGGETYNGDIRLVGFLANEKETAPYVAIGFGRVASNGIGLFIDLGASPMGEANIEFTETSCKLSGTSTDCPSSGGKTFQQSANEEANQAEEDAGGFLEWHPILQIGLKFGFGR